MTRRAPWRNDLHPHKRARIARGTLPARLPDLIIDTRGNPMMTCSRVPRLRGQTRSCYQHAHWFTAVALRVRNIACRQHGVLIAGALEVGMIIREFAVAALDSIVLDEFDATRVIKFDAGAGTVLAAISSTIKRLFEHADEEPTNLFSPRLGPESPILLLDAGHHPYSDYYRRQSLRKLAEAASHRFAARSAAAVLASWQYQITKPAPSWCMPETFARFDRIIDGQDILDLVEIEYPG